MATITGKLLYLKFGATEVLDTSYRAFSATETSGVVDISAGDDTARTYLTTLKDGTATATVLILAGSTGTMTWEAMVPGTAGTLVWGEHSGSTGSPDHTVFAYVTERRKTAAYADLIIADVSWQFTSAVVDDKF